MSREEGENHLPGPAVHDSFDADQGTVGFLGSRCTSPAYVKLFIHQNQVRLRAALNPLIALPVFMVGIALTQAQGLIFGLVEPHEVFIGPPLKPVQVPLDDIPSLQHVDCTAWCHRKT